MFLPLDSLPASLDEQQRSAISRGRLAVVHFPRIMKIWRAMVILIKRKKFNSQLLVTEPWSVLDLGLANDSKLVVPATNPPHDGTVPPTQGKPRDIDDDAIQQVLCDLAKIAGGKIFWRIRTDPAIRH